MSDETSSDMPKLKGASNYAEWHRKIKAVASKKGLWSYITGENEVLKEPQLPPQPSRALIVVEKTGDFEPTWHRTTEAWKRKLDKYQRDMEELQRQSQQMLVASRFLQRTIDPAVLADFEITSSPFDTYNAIKKKFGYQNLSTFYDAHRGLQNLRIRDYEGWKGFGDYLQRAQELREQLRNTHPGTVDFDDTYFIAALIGGLTDEYEGFINRWIAEARSKSVLSYEVFEEKLSHEAYFMHAGLS